MRALLLPHPNSPLQFVELPTPQPGPHEILLRIHCCGICRTDLHLQDGEIPFAHYPIIPGHQIVGRVAACGKETTKFCVGERVGVSWLGSCCNQCPFCLSGKENLCPQTQFTGCQRNGGFADYCVAEESSCFSLPSIYSDEEAAPLLCAGMVGYRAYAMIKEKRSIGFYGFGSSAHILTQLAASQGKEIYVFTKPNDTKRQAFAKKMGAVWSGGVDQQPPLLLDAAIIFASAGELIPLALKSVQNGGTVVAAGIQMSDIPSFPYSLLWGEKCVRSVANLTKREGKEFLQLAQQVPLRLHLNLYPIEQANQALSDMRKGGKEGSFVLQINPA